MSDYMDDCIHIKACRRVQKIGKMRGHSFGRHCAETCTAYVSGNDVLKEIQDALEWSLEQGWNDMDYVKLSSKDGDRIVEWLKGGDD